MMDEMIKVEHLKKYYPVGKTWGKKTNLLKAVDDVSLTITKGKIYGIVGESGCGKTTLGRCIMRLTDQTEGKIYFRDAEISSLSQSDFRKYRSKIQMIFQNPYSSFNPKITVGSSLQEVLNVHHIDKIKAAEKITALLKHVNLPEDALNRRPGELSGGQLQRFAIGRALLLEPDFIVADEPVSALDVSVQAQILNLILELRDELQLTLMFISHDLIVVENICDEAAVFYLGKIVEKAPISKLFGAQSHPYTQALHSAKPRENPRQKTSRIILQGEISDAINIPEGCRFASRCPECWKGYCDKLAPELKEVEKGHFIACHKFQ